MLKRSRWSEFALCGVALIAVLLAAMPSFAQTKVKYGAATNPEAASVERGRYLAKTAGCNDCHTAGYMPSAGKVPESAWLKGDTLGWNGPWGTTYAPNLRIFMSKLTEEQWVRFAQTAELRPPMPWFALRDMTEADQRSLYRFVRSLGAPGEPAPAYLPPGQTPTGPFVSFPAPPK
jgi:mono/diheme cytochrome c family protein